MIPCLLDLGKYNKCYSPAFLATVRSQGKDVLESRNVSARRIGTGVSLSQLFLRCSSTLVDSVRKNSVIRSTVRRHIGKLCFSSSCGI